MKKRTVGDILLDMEPILEELVDQGLQAGDILALVHVWITTHAPGAIEVYNEGGSPEFYYGYRRK